MKILKLVVAAILTLLLSFVVWGRIEPQFYDVEEQTATIPGLPEAWEGRRVAQISDWQIGMWLDNPSTVRDIIGRIVEEQPSAVLITGDFVYHAIEGSEREILKAADLAGELTEEGLSVYAVLGNHDYGVASETADANERLANRMIRELRRVGVRVLRNESVVMSLDGEVPVNDDPQSNLYLVGIGPEWPERANVDKALSGVPQDAPRIVMMHNPDTYVRIPPGEAPLAVAGHTHGGQVRLPFLSEWSWLTLIRPGYVTADGWIEEYDVPGNRLYVNRGIGFGVVPLRIFCAPELTIYTLRKENPGGSHPSTPRSNER